MQFSRVDEPLFNVPSEGEEGFIDVCLVLGRSFHKFESVLARQFSASFAINDPSFNVVTLVSNQDFVYAVVGELFNVPDPVADVIEGAFIGDIVDQHDSHGAAVVSGGDGAEAFLAGRVPDLEFYAFAVEVDGANFEVDSDGADEGGCEGVIAEPH